MHVLGSPHAISPSAPVVRERLDQTGQGLHLILPFAPLGEVMSRLQ